MAGDSNGYSSISQGSVGTYSNLQQGQVYKDKGGGNKDPYAKKDTYGIGRNPYRQDSVYANNDSPYSEDDRILPKYRRFADLKILNEIMMHMSNNTLSDDSRIEILSQGEKGEIKNILSYRILKISIVPALLSLIFGLVVIISNSFTVILFTAFVFFALLVRTFFYPAKLYYENIKYKTTTPAKAFYEEMDYWYKISVVKVYIYLTIVSIFMFVVSFYEDEVILMFAQQIESFPKLANMEFVGEYFKTVSFGLGLKMIALFNVLLLVLYSKFANKEKDAAEIELREKMKKIRNETLSRVEQIQADKNSINE
jgi:hypothetical protein